MAKRTYQNDAIRVGWDPTRCIHVGKCIRTLGAVFDTTRRPWVDLEAADVEAIAATVELCPSGALTYSRMDGGAEEKLPDVPIIVPRANGPLMITGRVRVQTAGGDVFEEAGRMTLCRCGASKNQPFCDNAHREIKFRDNPTVVSPDRSAATHPAEVAAEAQPDP